MNGAQLHLAVNHIPVIGVPACALILAAGLWRKSRDLVGAGFIGLVLLALATAVAFNSGGAAAHLIRGLAGITRAQIHEHAEGAEWAFGATNILGLLGLIGLWRLKRSPALPRDMAVACLAGALFATTIFVTVAHEGGLIRHPEIAADFQPSSAAAPATPETPPVPPSR